MSQPSSSCIYKSRRKKLFIFYISQFYFDTFEFLSFDDFLWYHNLSPSSWIYKSRRKNSLSLYISQSYFDIFEFLNFDDFLQCLSPSSCIYKSRRKKLFLCLYSPILFRYLWIFKLYFRISLETVCQIRSEISRNVLTQFDQAGWRAER